MWLPPTFVITILTTAAQPPERDGKVLIIIRRPYAYLEPELARAFQGQEDVHVLVDHRYGERRARAEAVTLERRVADRRRPKEDLAAVVLTDSN